MEQRSPFHNCVVFNNETRALVNKAPVLFSGKSVLKFEGNSPKRLRVKNSHKTKTPCFRSFRLIL